MFSRKTQEQIEQVLGVNDLEAFLRSTQTLVAKARMSSELRQALAKLWLLPELIESLESTSSGDLNLRYNEMISEMASLVRESLMRQRLKNEMDMASAVQKALMPPSSMDYGHFSVSGRCYAAESCGGDWWFHARRGDKLLVWIGDVLGHDIGAALVASACRGTVSALHVENIDAPVEQQMSIMNDVIYSMTKGEVYLTAICLEVDLLTGDLEIGTASHPPCIAVRGQETGSGFIETPMDPPLGLSPGHKFQRTLARLEPGQGLFLMTDGLMEVPTREGTHWREPRLMRLLSTAVMQQHHADGLIQALEQYIFSIGSGDLSDDMTYVAVHRKAA
ncbi:MAG: serine/threonine-protein phosphatase [Bdellovibrionales bacterium]|nr:serine/threonine-protein phosphatase [Bdellovibrionales bacterium]